MSHATCVVRVSEERLARHKGKLESVLKEMMAPYNEEPEKRFLEFEDQEDEHRALYESTELHDMCRKPNGELVFPWRATPDGVPVKATYKEKYKTFEQFCKDYSALDRHPETGKHGHWHNPNARWDWYSIGGRWSGYFHLKGDREPTDVVHVTDIDFDKVTAAMHERAEKFWNEWQAWLAKPDGDYFSTRSQAINLGIIRIVQGPATAGEGELTISWETYYARRENDRDEHRSWTDVIEFLSKEAFLQKYLEDFNPLVSFAALDDDGWHEPGRLGWFGMSSKTPESSRQWARAYMQRFIHAAKPTDLLVLVDYHI